MRGYYVHVEAGNPMALQSIRTDVVESLRSRLIVHTLTWQAWEGREDFGATAKTVWPMHSL